jgi:putative SOS response-associated peptidase YedK
MCVHYESTKAPVQFILDFGVEPAADAKTDVWHRYVSTFIRRQPHATGTTVSTAREALLGIYGLVPHWSEELKIKQNTYNARIETVSQLASYRDPWRKAQHCIVPAAAFYEPDHRSGKPRPARFERKDGKHMGIAGLWDKWRSPEGEDIYSFTMLTLNADDHPLMKDYHRANEEKRMVVILPEDRYDDWLKAKASESMEFIRQYPSELLVATTQGN